MAEPSQAMNLQWAFGFSSEVSNSVVDISVPGQDRVCYIAAHTAIIYDLVERQQVVLQGHCNPITCLCVTEDKRVIVTADAGEDSMVVLWDADSGQPIQTIQNAHATGVIAMDISKDGQYLITFSAGYRSADNSMGGMEQEISLWDLGEEGSLEVPAAVGNVPAGDVQTCVHFSPETTAEIISNGKQRVYFWKTQLPLSKEFKYYSPPVSARDFKQAIGDFTVSVFIPGTMMAVTGTVDGDVVVWEEGQMIEPSSRPTDRRAVKILRIHFASVTSLVTVDDYIVSGSADGNVRFYDGKLRLCAWFDEIDAGEVTSISFSTQKTMPLKENLDDNQDRFAAPDFIVGTRRSRIISIKADSFEKYDKVARQGELVIEGTHDSVQSLTTHPMRPEFCVTGSAGVIWLWNYSTKQLVATRQFEKLKGSVLAYAPDGSRLAVGCTNGSLRLLNPNSLEDIQAFRFTTGAAVAIAFSADMHSIALADANNFVSLVTYGHGKSGDKWEFVGKYGSHTGRVSGLAFEGLGPATRLFSTGHDGLLVEYDVPGSSIAEGVRLVQHSDIGKGQAVATALTVAPPTMRSPTGGPLLITADSAFKFRTYDAATQGCKATVLGPTYGGPLNHLQVFQTAGKDDYYLAYATPDKVIGLTTFPLDGDPSRAMGLIAHPGEVAAIAVTYDGRRILTAGGRDSIVNMWGIDVSSLDPAPHVSLSSKSPNAYMSLLEGGQDGEFYSEIKDYFYYSQIHSQGEDVTDNRKIEGKCVLSEVPNLMRALGYYPSESEVADMMAELHGEALEQGLPAPTHISFDRFIALYTNHRPVIGVGKEQLTAAFAALGAEDGGVLDSDELVQALTTEGEPMERAELEQCLVALCGTSKLDDVLPPDLGAKTFAEEILGFENYE